MKPTFKILLLTFAAMSFVGVSCAVAKVPATTMKNEKAIVPTSVELFANSYGAITLPVHVVTYDAILAQPMVCSKCLHCVDETFYRNGYKAKLNTEVKEVIVPPDSKRKIYLSQLKQC